MRRGLRFSAFSAGCMQPSAIDFPAFLATMLAVFLLRPKVRHAIVAGLALIVLACDAAMEDETYVINDKVKRELANNPPRVAIRDELIRGCLPGVRSGTDVSDRVAERLCSCGADHAMEGRSDEDLLAGRRNEGLGDCLRLAR